MGTYVHFTAIHSLKAFFRIHTHEYVYQTAKYVVKYFMYTNWRCLELRRFEYGFVLRDREL